uniref:Uncharacterized protein n=1 Tax=Lactuca sativa TaxID=4236 RepID=A0A9R1WMI9_LACSA|nr:hypothetical protein LSAT_V11C100045760 [Lactuca sativa]
MDDDVFVDNTPNIIDDDDGDTDKGDIKIEDNTALPKEKNKRQRAPPKTDQNVGIQWKWLWTKMERKPINLSISIALKSLIPICVAHILNLIVRDGLRYHNTHVSCVQRAVKCISHSTARIRKFTKCMKDFDLEGDKFLCGECPTRWSSTFELLKSALNLKDAFFEYEVYLFVGCPQEDDQKYENGRKHIVG